jgi:hypothetical protein
MQEEALKTEAPKADKGFDAGSDFDNESMMSNPIDNIMNMDGAGDPRSLKTSMAPMKTDFEE